MNKKQQLLIETLTDGAGEAYARAAAAHVRRRRSRKQLAAGVAAFAAVTLVWIGANRPKPVTPATTAARPAYEIISDAQLLAQLQDQPVLLLKEQDRITGVVFLNPAAGKL